MSLEYSERKRLSRLVDRHSKQVEQDLEEDHGEVLAKIASNRVFDAIHQDDQLAELISIANSAEQITEDRGRPSEDEIGDAVETAWFQIEDSIEARCEEIVDDAVDSVLEREVTRA